MKKVFYFDMDDTLIQTQEQYESTSKETAEYIKNLLNLNESIQTIMDKMNEIDLENIKTYGFSPKRYPLSWKQTYFYYLKENEEKYTKEAEKIEKAAYDGVFGSLVSVYPNTYETLNSLMEKGFELILLTAGDEEIQKKRIEDANLKPYFQETIIVPMKNPKVLAEILNRRGHSGENAIMVGNSLRSDIYPALEAGMKAIHLNQGSWKYDEYEVDTENGNYFQISSIEQVLELLS